MKGKPFFILLAVMVLLGGAGTWCFWRYFRVDPRVREIEALQTRIEQMAPPAGGRPNFEQVRPAFEEMRTKIEALPEEQKEQVEDAMRQRFFAHMQERDRQRMAEFFALPQPQRVAALDKEIDEHESRRAEWAKRMAETQNASATTGSNAQPGTAAGNPAPPTAGAPSGPGAPPPGAGRDRMGFRNRMANMTPEQRKEMSRRFLDNSTPEHRAQRAEYVRLMQQRRKERGLAAAPAGPFGPGFGPPPGAVAISAPARPSP